MQDMQGSKLPRAFLAALIFISMCGPLGMNIVLPSLSSYQDVFQTDYASAQLTLTFYLAAIAIAQLIYGPISDRIGRKPIIFFGLSVLIIGSFVCMLATSIEMMIAGRMIQAFGGCAGMVMGRAMVRDRYDADAAASVIAYLTMAIVIAPTLAPALGGVLEDQFGWQASFIFVSGFAVITLMVVFVGAQETLPPEKRHKARFASLFLSYGHLLRNPKFMAYALQVSFCTSAYFAFLGGSSFVLVDLMGGTASQLGMLFVVVSIFYILGNFATAKFTQKLGVSVMIRIGASISVLGALMLYTWEMTIGLGPFSFFGLMSIVALGNGFCISSGIATAIGADPDRVGAASGLAGSMQIGFGALSTFIAGSLLAAYETTPMPLILVVIGCCVLGLLSFLVGEWRVRRMAY
ncbi:hypothetical protein A9Q83_08095 [Alphaproteobacteria bacterium 46_93_T64]|nr:hypothetical protein A9Q83_08095 [Alphaproteobacteria bacterium 46_93_T64]